MPDIDFTQVLKDGGLPTTQTELDAQWKTDAIDQGTNINNDNTFSPFWRVVSALITKPALWVIEFLANTSLPQAFVQTATGVFLELLADGVNLSRKKSVKALGNVTFTRIDTAVAVNIPADTVIQTASINGAIYQLKTIDSADFVGANSTLDVAVSAVSEGSSFNLSAGYYSILPVAISNISGVTNANDWLTTPGADIETDEALRARIRNQFGLVSDFHTDSVYRSLIASFKGVAVDHIWFVHNAPRGAGTANAYVLFEFTAPTASYLSNINAFITDDDHHGHGDDLQVFQLPTQNQTLTVEVWYEPTLSAAEITQLQSDIVNFVNAAYRENNSYSPSLTWPYARFSFSQLGRECHAQFEGIHSMSFSLSDFVTALWVPRLTSLTVNMQVTE